MCKIFCSFSSETFDNSYFCFYQGSIKSAGIVYYSILIIIAVCVYSFCFSREGMGSLFTEIWQSFFSFMRIYFWYSVFEAVHSSSCIHKSYSSWPPLHNIILDLFHIISLILWVPSSLWGWHSLVDWVSYWWVYHQILFFLESHFLIWLRILFFVKKIVLKETD